jgi:peptidylprolyl isomerase
VINHRIKIVLFVLLGCAAAITLAQGTPEGVVGKMGAIELKTAELRRILEAQPPQVKKQVAGAMGDLDRLVRSELIRQSLLNEAKAKGIDKKPEVALMMDRARDQALLQAYMTDIARPPTGFPTDDDVKQAYESNKAALAMPAEFNLAQIFVALPENADKTAVTAATKKAADLAAKAQAKGADFAKLAREQSEQKETAAKGGDLGWLPENQIIVEIRAAVLRLEKGEVTAPIRSASGFHIVKLLDKKPAGVRPLAEVRETIVNQMRLRRAQEIERNYIEGMVSRSQVTINQSELGKLQVK